MELEFRIKPTYKRCIIDKEGKTIAWFRSESTALLFLTCYSTISSMKSMNDLQDKVRALTIEKELAALKPLIKDRENQIAKLNAMITEIEKKNGILNHQVLLLTQELNKANIHNFRRNIETSDLPQKKVENNDTSI